MKSLVLALSFLSFLGLGLGTHTAQASAAKQWIIREALPNGQVEVRVIQEIPASANRQNVLPQQVIYKKIMSPRDAADFRAPLSEIVLTAQPGKPLWDLSEAQWTQADEDDYSNWFATQVTVDLLSGTGLVADCADMGLLFRWVYARNHQLPIANTLSGSGQLFGHFSSSADWDKLPQDPDWRKDERFKAALRYLFDNTYTRTVVADLFPTFVTPQYVRPGSMFMIIRKTSGHTQTIHQVDLSHGITTFWGNEPAAEKIFSTAMLVEVENQQTFGMWRYVAQDSFGQWSLISADQMPGYTATQFPQTFDDPDTFSDWLNAQLGIHISDADRLMTLVQNFSDGLMWRVSLTAMAMPVCYLTPCDPSSQAYSDYSTFSRDARLVTEQNQILPLIAKLGVTSAPVVAALAQAPAEEIIPGSGVTYLDLVQDQAALAKLSADPRVSFAERWGITGSALTPTIDFNSDATALEFLLWQRVFSISQAMESADLDSGIKKVLQATLSANQVTGVDADALSLIRASYQKQTTKVTGEDCGHADTGCTLDDFVFTDDAQTRLPHWSSVATDSMAKRWGF